jgi:hypothetical protein
MSHISTSTYLFTAKNLSSVIIEFRFLNVEFLNIYLYHISTNVPFSETGHGTNPNGFLKLAILIRLLNFSALTLQQEWME